MNLNERPEKAVPGTSYYEVSGDPDDTAFAVVYDSEEVEVVTRGFGIHEAIEVRKSMVDQAVRHAAVVELERLGYTVIAPVSVEGCLKGCSTHDRAHHPECPNRSRS